MDINFTKGIYNIFNAIIYTVFQLPAVTALRCVKHGIDPRTKGLKPAGGSILMCLPDFNAPINMFIAGIRNLGVLGDNWLDVSSIIAQRSLGLLDDQLDCESTAKSLTPAFYSRQLFSSNTRQKIVVGLTDGLYAVTDGLHAQYFNHYDSVESVASPNVWPIEIDTRFGVAAVTYRAGSGSEERDGMVDTTTTMLGCRCTDNEGLPPMRIQCALALKGVGTASAIAYASDTSYASPTAKTSADSGAAMASSFQTVFDVVFQQRSTAAYITCSMAKISVQSVRWPATLFTGRWALTHIHTLTHTQHSYLCAQISGCACAYDASTPAAVLRLLL